MNPFMAFLTTFGDVLLVIAGFGLIIFFHEMGHFVAARWAGIRVMAFALGFGPAVVSFRKGLGFRFGSSEREYLGAIKDRADGRGLAPGISPTEYRFNAFPLGGYVKMLGQDDSDPTARSDAPDSYQNCPPVKRMVVISAGVVMNLIIAAVLFVVVFWVGLKTETPRIGHVERGFPAALAVAQNADALGITSPGLKPGDRVISVDGEEIEAFTDMRIAVAMSRKGRALPVVVERGGVKDRLIFNIIPKEDKATGLLGFGVTPLMSGRVVAAKNEKQKAEFEAAVKENGPAGLKPGMRLPGGHNEPWIAEELNKAGGRPVTIEFETAEGGTAPVTIKPVAQMQVNMFDRAGTLVSVDHIAGLAPVLRIASVAKDREDSGLKAGDIVARIGETQWPCIEDAIREIKSPRDEIFVTVLRTDEHGVQSLKDLPKVPVRNGQIGFTTGTTADITNHVTRLPRGKILTLAGEAAPTPGGAETEIVPGSRVVAVVDRPTATLREVRDAICHFINAGVTEMTLKITLPDQAGSEEIRVLRLSPDEAKAIAGLGWTSPVNPGFFEPDEFLMQRSSPIAAIGKGLHETRKMILTTYLTFARLVQGSVKVEHLKGPVGIAHVGTLLADKGFIWLLFFMAAVSVNLAVINFLPLPIVDGGHFLFLVWEQFTGKPVSVAVQNVSAIVGLVLIGSVFLVTTYNDLANLLFRH